MVTSLKLVYPLDVVISNEKPAMSTPVIPLLVRVTSKLLDDEPGMAVPSRGAKDQAGGGGRHADATQTEASDSARTTRERI